MTGTAGVPVVLTGTGLVCPEGDSIAAVPDGPPDGAPGGPDMAARSWFDPAAYLGPRGWRYHSPATRYLLAAATLAVADARLDLAAGGGDSLGVVIGTNFAAAGPVARFDETVISRDARHLSAAEAPNFSVNVPAGHVSIRFGLRGLNLTLTNPAVAGLEAIGTLVTSIRAGRLAAGLAGATEEIPDVPGVHPAPSEGACCVVLERGDEAAARGGPARAEVVGGFSRFLPADAITAPAAHHGAWKRALGGPLTRLLDGHTGEVPLAVLPGPVATDWLTDYCARHVPAHVSAVATPCPGTEQRHQAVSGLLAAAGLVARHGHGVVVCVGVHGHVAAVALRRVQPGPSAGPTAGQGTR